LPNQTTIKGPLGIIAGGGRLPIVLAEMATARSLPLHIVAIRSEASVDVERFPHTWIKWGEVGKLFAALDKNGCTDLVIIGGVTRPDLRNIKFDLGALTTLPFLLSLGKGGDDNVLSRVVRFFEEKGYRVHGAGDVAPDLLVEKGTLSPTGPSTDDEADMEIAFNVVRALGRLDIGQAAVVAKGHVLAVEAAEGTDAMLDRCAELRRSGRAKGSRTGVLVKAPKPGQEERVDMPTIGPDTVRKAAAAGLAGVAVTAGHTLIADRPATVKAAKETKLFLVGVPWIDAEKS